MDKRLGFRLAIERLAHWWTQASQADRFTLLTRAIHGDAEAPPLQAVHLAAFLAETEQGGQVDQGELGR
jgi:hypothetical protein